MLERALRKAPRWRPQWPWRCDDLTTSSTTLLPFLYHTRTIQRRQYVQLPYEEDNIPFEGGADEREKSTITHRERQTFEKLFSLQRKSTSKETGLDRILEDAVGQINARGHPKPRLPSALRPLAEEARDLERAAGPTSRVRKGKAPTGEDEKRSRLIKKEYDDITARLQKEPTDVGVTRMLKSLLLDRVAAMGLDNDIRPSTTMTKAKTRALTSEKKHAKKKASDTPKAEKVDALRIMTTNLSLHLQDYMHHMRTTFPSSTLPLLLLPHLKTLGPAAFALGATTTLYNAHLSLLHSKYPLSLHLLNDTLAEMDSNVYAFDDETLEIVDEALRRTNRARHGHEGPALQAVFGAERIGKGVQGLVEWRDVMLARRQEEALRKARSISGGEGLGMRA
ncbi:hypothetical protein LTR62_001412 [Meristemomyces frigidus]|uniref:Mtf2-like C-terminal domain-containing protein n=1 Tax=Meristemomyces frigidus TaxID=1508187 RepID=A0AAN7T990_9PEZI|nr:hypothetical protein LTR62_001412 [Meristemomyces frigidus]